MRPILLLPLVFSAVLAAAASWLRSGPAGPDFGGDLAASVLSTSRPGSLTRTEVDALVRQVSTPGGAMLALSGTQSHMLTHEHVTLLLDNVQSSWDTSWLLTHPPDVSLTDDDVRLLLSRVTCVEDAEWVAFRGHHPVCRRTNWSGNLLAFTVGDANVQNRPFRP